MHQFRYKIAECMRYEKESKKVKTPDISQKNVWHDRSYNNLEKLEEAA